MIRSRASVVSDEGVEYEPDEVRLDWRRVVIADGEYPPNTLLFVQRLVETRLLIEIEGIAIIE